MSEALVALDRIADAVQELNPDTIADVSVDFPEAASDQGAGRLAIVLIGLLSCYIVFN